MLFSDKTKGSCPSSVSDQFTIVATKVTIEEVCAGLDLILKKIPGASKEDLKDCIKKFNDQNKYTLADLFCIQDVIMIHMNLFFIFSALNVGVRPLNSLLLWPWLWPCPLFWEDRFNTLVNTEIQRI